MRYVCRWEWDEHDDDETPFTSDDPEDAASEFVEKHFSDISYHGKPIFVVARDEMGVETEFKVYVDWDPSFHFEKQTKGRP